MKRATIEFLAHERQSKQFMVLAAGHDSDDAFAVYSGNSTTCGSANLGTLLRHYHHENRAAPDCDTFRIVLKLVRPAGLEPATY